MKKIEGDFINPYGEHIFNAETYTEIMEENIKAFLYE